MIGPGQPRLTVSTQETIAANISHHTLLLRVSKECAKPRVDQTAGLLPAVEAAAWVGREVS